MDRMSEEESTEETAADTTWSPRGRTSRHAIQIAESPPCIPTPIKKRRKRFGEAIIECIIPSDSETESDEEEEGSWHPDSTPRSAAQQESCDFMITNTTCNTAQNVIDDEKPLPRQLTFHAAAHTPPPDVSIVSTTRPLSASSSTIRPLLNTKKDPTTVSFSDWRALAHMIVPCPLFRSSSALRGFSLKHINLKWLCPGKELLSAVKPKKAAFKIKKPGILHNLSDLPFDYLPSLRRDTLRSSFGCWMPDNEKHVEKVTLLNSPRSVIVLMRNGISLQNLLSKKKSKEEATKVFTKCVKEYENLKENFQIEEVINVFEDYWNQYITSPTRNQSKENRSSKSLAHTAKVEAAMKGHQKTKLEHFNKVNNLINNRISYGSVRKQESHVQNFIKIQKSVDARSRHKDRHSMVLNKKLFHGAAHLARQQHLSDKSFKDAKIRIEESRAAANLNYSLSNHWQHIRTTPSNFIKNKAAIP